jgi:hypothetical protein
MKVCVLQPDYSTTNVDYKNYDPPRELASLLSDDDVVDHVFLNKLTTYRQLKDLSKQGYDIFVNLCEGYLEWEVPSIDVIHSLELLKQFGTASCFDCPLGDLSRRLDSVLDRRLRGRRKLQARRRKLETTTS